METIMGADDFILGDNKMKIKIPNDLSYEDMDHGFHIHPAFSPDYDAEDIGKGFDLTVTVFGFQLGSDEIKKLVNELNRHLIVDEIHQFLKSH
jgi:hypothetical protein